MLHCMYTFVLLATNTFNQGKKIIEDDEKEVERLKELNERTRE